MVTDNLLATNNEPQEPFTKELKSERILSEIVHFAIEHKDNHLKVAEVLQIEENGENILMSVLKEKRFDLMKELLTLGHLLIKDTILLSQNKAFISYLFAYGSDEIISEVLLLLQSYAEPTLIKAIFSYKDRNLSSSLIILLKVHHNPEFVFDPLVNFITNNLGLDFLYQELLQLDEEGNNAILLALKLKKEKILEKIISLGEKMDKELITKLLSQSNDLNENVLSLLAKEELYDATHNLLELFYANRDNQQLLLKIVEQDLEGNNALMIGMIHHNKPLLEGLLKVIETSPDHSKKLILNRLCSDQNIHYDNFITLAFREGHHDIYLALIKEVEKHLEENKVLALLKRSLSRNGSFIKDVFLSSNSSAILSIIQYIKVLQNLSPTERRTIERLILHKDKNNRILLLSAIIDEKIESIKLILDLVLELGDNLTYKLLLNSRDSNGNTAYLLARKKKNLLMLIKSFAETTHNQFYLEMQEREARLLEKIQQNPLSIISIKRSHLSG
jgi:hypothetical protein